MATLTATQNGPGEEVKLTGSGFLPSKLVWTFATKDGETTTPFKTQADMNGAFTREETFDPGEWEFVSSNTPGDQATTTLLVA